MPLVTMRQILDHAAENNYGVPAFNINDMEQVIAVLQAARKVNAPDDSPHGAGRNRNVSGIADLYSPRPWFIGRYLSVSDC